MPARKIVVLGVCALGCGQGAPRSNTARAPLECAVQLDARAAPSAVPLAAAPRSAALSTIVLHGEIRLATLGASLEARVPRRLAEGRFGIGPAGSVTYSAERGPLTFSIVENQLVVEAPVQARAEACRGQSCYASCEPEAIASARLPLLLRPDYGFDHARAALRFTRGCKVKALGGFLTVDVTPTLARELEPELAKVARQIDGELRGLREAAERIWQRLSPPRELPLGGCLVLQPQRFVQGPLSDSSTLVHARFAILAQPELRATCAALPASVPLPPLEHRLSMPDEGRVMLGLVTPLGAVQRAFASAPDGTVDGRHVRVTQPRVTPLGSNVVVELTLGGDLCGELAFTATPSFAKDGAFIGLSRPRWLEGEAQRAIAQGVEPDRLLRALAAIPRLPPLLSATAIQGAAPALAPLLSTSELDVDATISAARGAGAAAREDQLVAWIEMLGRLDVKPSSAPKKPAR